MRSLWIVILLVVVSVSGCSQAPAITAGGKPIEFWFESLKSHDAKLRKKAVAKLCSVGTENPAVFPALVGALKDPDADVRCAAVVALANIGPAGRYAISVLDEVRRKDRNARVRNHAARVVASLQQGG